MPDSRVAHHLERHTVVAADLDHERIRPGQFGLQQTGGDLLEVHTHRRRARRPEGIVGPEHPVPVDLFELLHHRAGPTEPDGEPVEGLLGQLAGPQEGVGHRLAAEVETLADFTPAQPAG
jgi:hypothetical protein